MSAVASLAQNLFRRHRDRLQSEPVESHDRNADDVEIENEPVANGVIRHEEEGSFLNDPQAENNNNNNNNNNNTQDERENSNNTSRDGIHSFVARPTMTLGELGAVFPSQKRQYFCSSARSNDDPNPSLGNRNVLHKDLADEAKAKL
jgi:hypothetical protein